MGIEALNSEPIGRDAAYLIRISVFNGRNGYEGPCQVDKDNRGINYPGQTRVALPLNGPARDDSGVGIFGFTTCQTGMYDVIRQLATKSFDPNLVKWQVFSTLKDELSPDPEGWRGVFSAKRIWVCFSGNEIDAWKYYHRAKFIQSSRRFLNNGN